ncbi:unnamed protein product [Paramecium octaurelia]|uniref:Uncharacterized protein n=1 Tax=Paramecium octaurelia TaxID=43137 RepID=A0A8S1XHX9_PAROT|nr:unnamed protein product [Paramecium octaurelia]
MVIKKLKEYKLHEEFELTKQRRNFKSILSQTQTIIKKFKELTESLKYIYDFIEMENESFDNLIHETLNLADLSYNDLEKLESIAEGKKLNDWIDQKNQYLIQLEKAQSWWDQEVKNFRDKLTKEMREIMSFIKQVFMSQKGFNQLKKQHKFINGNKIYLRFQLYQKIWINNYQGKITDCIGFLSKNFNKKQQQEYVSQGGNSFYLDKLIMLKIVENDVMFIANQIRNIHEIEFNKKLFLNQIQRHKERFNKQNIRRREYNQIFIITRSSYSFRQRIYLMWIEFPEFVSRMKVILFINALKISGLKRHLQLEQILRDTI